MPGDYLGPEKLGAILVQRDNSSAKRMFIVITIFLYNKLE